MDSGNFDALARGLAAFATRRRAVSALIGLVAGAGVVAGAEAADSRRSYCRKVDAICTRNSQCCSGACDTSRVNHRTRRNRCVCIPDCTDKVCGSDGCGGTCGDFDGACEYDFETCNAGVCENACSAFDGDRFCYELLDGSTVVSPEGCTGWNVSYISCSDDAVCKAGDLAPYDNAAGGWGVICARRQFYGGGFTTGTDTNAIPEGNCFAYKLESAVC